MTVNEKVKLLDMLEAGSTCSTVARIHGLNESTVRYIKKDEENIRRTASVMLCTDSKRLMSRRNEMVVQMENALSVWIWDCRKKNIPLDTNMIRSKAKNLYDRLASEGDFLP